MLKIKEFSVNRLHDVYTYNLKFDEVGGTDISILYGDNGSGKTTLLKLLYHMLSSSGEKGHLTAIAKVPFHSALITLSDGTMVFAQRENTPNGYPIHFSVQRLDKPPIFYSFVPERYKSGIAEEAIARQLAKSLKPGNLYRHAVEPHKLRNIREAALEKFSESAHSAYCDALKQLSITLYFLGTERRILNDQIEQWSLAAPREQAERPEDQIATLRAAYLRDALQRGGRYLNRQIIRASNTGSKNTNDIYAEIFKRILNEDSLESSDRANSIRSLVAELKWLQRRQRHFVKLGLSPDLEVASFLTNFDSAPLRTKLLLEKVLVPFVATLRARLDAMEPIRQSVETFLGSLNSFLKFKSIEYMPANGFQILGPLGDQLDVQQLSSGEQQLLLMFCSVLASNESPCIFIIDEPEISLNVKWQREILESLRKIMRGSENQMLISTHSIELLAQHSDTVVALDPVITRAKQLPIESEHLE